MCGTNVVLMAQIAIFGALTAMSSSLHATPLESERHPTVCVINANAPNGEGWWWNRRGRRINTTLTTANPTGGGGIACDVSTHSTCQCAAAVACRAACSVVRSVKPNTSTFSVRTPASAHNTKECHRLSTPLHSPRIASHRIASHLRSAQLSSSHLCSRPHSHDNGDDVVLHDDDLPPHRTGCLSNQITYTVLPLLLLPPPSSLLPPPSSPYTLPPTPCTLHPTPYTLHPTPSPTPLPSSMSARDQVSHNRHPLITANQYIDW
ncbi:hypothetical protein TcWFU_007340 [Taenia crassiceps]|uniref:Uncharacterized protein n=1 Tax=Taenia crassiceps TaxID=6207 RepID=A0ABR4QHU9_9CEST